MPVFAACTTCTPLPMPSRRLLLSLARESRPWAVKKLVGLSSAVLIFLPVDKRFWVVASRSAVDCSESRFWRTEAESTMDNSFPFLDQDYATPRNFCHRRITLFRCCTLFGAWLAGG